jgi:predicted alpha/beta superfamily hydrolase
MKKTLLLQFLLIIFVSPAVVWLLLQPGKVRLAGTEVHSLRSDYTGEKYKIWVSLPTGYEGDTKSYPVIYLPDAEICFAAASSIVREMALGNEIPQVILVGIAYDTTDKEYALKRRKDLTPTVCGGFDGPTGGAEMFRLFIRDELIPWTERQFRTQPDNRTLAGFSYGGLFALHSLFAEPGLFQHWLAASPSLWWDSYMTLRRETDFFSASKELRAKLFISTGENETVQTATYPMAKDAAKFCKTLASRRYKGLSLKFVILPEESHRASFPAAFTKGIRFLYSGSAK